MSSSSWRLALVSAVMIASGAGCAFQSALTPSWTPSQTAGTARVPRIQDCAIVSISSPSKYACNGKVYTSFQLAKARLDQEKQLASGK